jgi:hypothetical protein
MKFMNILTSALDAIDLLPIGIFAVNPKNMTEIFTTKQLGVRENNLLKLCRSIVIFLGHCVPRRKFRKCRG